MKVRECWDAYALLRPSATDRKTFFEIQDPKGHIDIATWGIVYLPGMIPEGLEYFGYYVAFSDHVPEMNKREEIRLYFEFSPERNKFSMKDRTKPKGKKRPDYEEVRNRATAFILAACVEV